jgi:hypothetical protein
MRIPAFLLVSLAALALAPGALAGGWSTVDLTTLPDQIGAGETWEADVQVLAHGVTPMNGLDPKITVSSGAQTLTYNATPNGKAGTYEAGVVFPAAGEWTVVVTSGYGDAPRTFGSVTVLGAEGSSGDDDSSLSLLWLIGAGLGLGGGAALVVRQRRRNPTMPAPALPDGTSTG